jgi:hypothetical protein
MGVRAGVCSVRVAELIWKALVRPTMEAAAEVMGEGKWAEAEAIQLRMGRKILRCSRSTNREAVLGELGWWSMEARRDMLRLLFWRRLVIMSEARVTKKIFRQGKQGYAQGKDGVRKGWGVDTKRVFEKYGIGERFDSEEVCKTKQEWKELIKGIIHGFEESRWRKAVESAPKLRTYKIFKKSLRMEHYLRVGGNGKNDRWRRKELARIRTGSNRLRVDTGRRSKQRLEAADRTCLVCNGPEVEDETHFLLECQAHAGLRERLEESVEEICGKKVTLSSGNKVEALEMLLGEHVGWKPREESNLCNQVCTFVGEAMKVRKAVVAAE